MYLPPFLRFTVSELIARFMRSLTGAEAAAVLGVPTNDQMDAQLLTKMSKLAGGRTLTGDDLVIAGDYGTTVALNSHMLSPGAEMVGELLCVSGPGEVVTDNQGTIYLLDSETVLMVGGLAGALPVIADGRQRHCIRTAGLTSPDHAIEGDEWFNTDTKRHYVYSDALWIEQPASISLTGYLYADGTQMTIGTLGTYLDTADTLTLRGNEGQVRFAGSTMSAVIGTFTSAGASADLAGVVGQTNALQAAGLRGIHTGTDGWAVLGTTVNAQAGVRGQATANIGVQGESANGAGGQFFSTAGSHHVLFGPLTGNDRLAVERTRGWLTWFYTYDSVARTGRLKTANITADREWSLPDLTGEIALVGQHTHPWSSITDTPASFPNSDVTAATSTWVSEVPTPLVRWSSQGKITGATFTARDSPDVLRYCTLTHGGILAGGALNGIQFLEMELPVVVEGEPTEAGLAKLPSGSYTIAKTTDYAPLLPSGLNLTGLVIDGLPVDVDLAVDSLNNDGRLSYTYSEMPSPLEYTSIDIEASYDDYELMTGRHWEIQYEKVAAGLPLANIYFRNYEDVPSPTSVASWTMVGTPLNASGTPVVAETKEWLHESIKQSLDGSPVCAASGNGPYPLTEAEKLNVRDNIGAGTSAQGINADVMSKHINFPAAGRTLKAQMQAGVSVDYMILGDSTGDGSGRWPALLSDKLAAAYPGFGVVHKAVKVSGTWTLGASYPEHSFVQYPGGVGAVTYYRADAHVATDLNKPTVDSSWVAFSAAVHYPWAWNTTVVQAPPKGELCHWWQPSPIPAWAPGTYSAGSFVTSSSKTWFSTVDSNVDSPGTTDAWLEHFANGMVQISGEDAPYLHGDGASTSTKTLDIEMDFTRPANTGGQRTIFGKADSLQAGLTAGYLRVDLYDGTPIFYWCDTVGTGVITAGAWSTVPIPSAVGTRIKLRIKFTPNNGSIRTCSFYYATISGGVWSAYTLLSTVNGAATQWVVPPGTLQFNGIYGAASGFSTSLQFYGFTSRRGIDGPIDCNLPVDQWNGYGVKTQALTGSPTITIWNWSWSGSSILSYLPVLPKPFDSTTYYIDYNLHFEPSNMVAAFVNLGHNGHYFSGGLRNVTEYIELAGAISARFPRATFIPMSQNAGCKKLIATGPDVYSFDYALAEPFKRMKISLVQKAALDRHWGFIDINRIFTEYTDDQTTLSLDGLHPNATGSEIWSDEIFKLITL